MNGADGANAFAVPNISMERVMEYFIVTSGRVQRDGRKVVARMGFEIVRQPKQAKLWLCNVSPRLIATCVQFTKKGSSEIFDRY